jgi:hypothetical protein
MNELCKLKRAAKDDSYDEALEKRRDVCIEVAFLKEVVQELELKLKTSQVHNLARFPSNSDDRHHRNASSFQKIEEEPGNGGVLYAPSGRSCLYDRNEAIDAYSLQASLRPEVLSLHLLNALFEKRKAIIKANSLRKWSCFAACSKSCPRNAAVALAEELAKTHHKLRQLKSSWNSRGHP